MANYYYYNLDGSIVNRVLLYCRTNEQYDRVANIGIFNSKKRKNTEFGFEDGDTFQNKCQTAFSCYVGIFTGDYQFSFKMQVSKNT